MSTDFFSPPGTILFLKDYQFNDGSSSDKILIVLCTNKNNTAFIYTLTTSKARLPQKLEKHGCQESPETDISVYVFEADQVIGTKYNESSQFSFDLNTFLFLQENVIEVPILKLAPYISSGRLSILGRLYSTVLKSLIECIDNSPLVKRGIKLKIMGCLSVNDLDY